ncbi:hypothetical protein LCGC14_1608490 [marine sediment metagenome]|uniref:Uncharacterized protein n=1 Tax=marine sediment metagenome TaxID=412755 RepID=A0A0F9IVN2_9ZZZZ
MTTEERIQKLEDVVGDIGRAVEELERRFQADIRDLKEQLSDEESDRTNEDTSLSDRIDDVE